MTLDIVKVAEQLPLLVARACSEIVQAESRAVRAVEVLRRAADDPEAFYQRVFSAASAWPLALPSGEPIDAAFAAPKNPSTYEALAVDGSSIDVDRHVPVDCYVVNLGWIRAGYGSRSGFEHGTVVDLQPVGDELVLRDTDDPSRESMVAGAVLELVRGIHELALLAAQAEQFASVEHPLMALLDGNLALWNLDKPGLPATIMQQLKEASLDALNRLQVLAEAGKVVFGAFVSGTGASNLAHSLRLVACPMQPQVVCRACPGKGTAERPCDAAGVPDDAAVLRAILKPGERSAVFLPHRANAGATAESWYESEGHRIAFFYLNVDGEIARIELPVWMTQVPERLGLLHALLVHQAAEGRGYPLVLQEAHEEAVITTKERGYFAAMLEREGELNGIPWLVSAKSTSKRVRSI